MVFDIVHTLLDHSHKKKMTMIRWWLDDIESPFLVEISKETAETWGKA